MRTRTIVSLLVLIAGREKMGTTEMIGKANDLAITTKIDGSVVTRTGITEITTGIATGEVAAAVEVAGTKTPNFKAEAGDQEIEAAAEEVREGIGEEADIGLLMM